MIHTTTMKGQFIFLLELILCSVQIVTTVLGECYEPPKRCEFGKPLPDVFCGRGPNRKDCPKGYSCNIDPADRFAVCCQEPPKRCEFGKPLPDVFCGRGPNRKDCPKGYTCNIDPADGFAVCCQEPPKRCEFGKPLPDVFCGRGPNRKDCPKGYTCNIDPADRFAVCCQDKCKLPTVTSSCRKRGKCWRYSDVNQECIQFKSGCCNDHPNQYKTLHQCQRSCKPESACTLPRDNGPCKGLCRRFYYDQKSMECKEFAYGCCQGNANKFMSKENCVKFCKTKTDPGEPLPGYFCGRGPNRRDCPKGYTCVIDPADRFAVCCKEKKPKLCKIGEPLPGVFCGRGPNRQDCKKGYSCNIDPADRFAVCCKDDPCALKKDPGPCKARFPRFYFDKATRTCKPFIYGGCKGNGNRFKTEKECLDVCNDACGSGTDPGKIRCIIAACSSVHKCPNFPCATCVPRCGGCFSQWISNGKDVTAKCFTKGY